MNVEMFVAATVGYCLGSFRDPVIILFAVVCGAVGRSRANPLWPLALSVAITAVGAFMAHFIWQVASRAGLSLGSTLAWRLYVNCVIGYVAYGIGRLAFRAPTADVAATSGDAPL